MYLKRGAHRRKIDIEIQLFKDDESELKRDHLFSVPQLLQIVLLFTLVSAQYSMRRKTFFQKETHKNTFNK